MSEIYKFEECKELLEFVTKTEQVLRKTQNHIEKLEECAIALKEIKEIFLGELRLGMSGEIEIIKKDGH